MQKSPNQIDYRKIYRKIHGRNICKDKVEKGTHQFLGGNIQRLSHIKRKETWNYPSGWTFKHSEEAKNKMRGPRKPYGPQSPEHRNNRLNAIKKYWENKKND